MRKVGAYLLALATLGFAGSGRASEFYDSCMGAQIFTDKDCTCIEGKASDADKSNMMAFLTADKVKAADGQIDEAKAMLGMETIGKHGEACDKEK